MSLQAQKRKLENLFILVYRENHFHNKMSFFFRMIFPINKNKSTFTFLIFPNLFQEQKINLERAFFIPAAFVP